jgi:uncharacterized protein (TIGR02453 family)
MAFEGWPEEAIDFYEGLRANNTKSYWHEHKAVYERSVRDPMEALLSELGDEFGPGRLFRPYRDVRFSKDKSPYTLQCGAHVGGGYIAFSADGLLVGSGLFMPEARRLDRFRDAVADERSGPALEAIVATLEDDGYDVGAPEVLKTAPKGYPRDHPRIALLKQKGVVMSRSWEPGPWLSTAQAKERVVACLRAARPLRAWLQEHVG